MKLHLPTMTNTRLIFIALALMTAGCGGTANMVPSEEGEAETASITVEEQSGSYLCTPAGSGPFPGVLYNHGGLGDAVGGDLEGTCRALAEAGYVGYSKLRRQTVSLEGHIDDVLAGVDYLQGLDTVDKNNISIIGFSRGGLLTLEAATLQSDFRKIVLMAPAPGNGKIDEVLEDIANVSAPVLILVAENDVVQADHVGIAEEVKLALEVAGKNVQKIVYPPFGEDGHELFFEVRGYWEDIVTFLGD